MVNEYKKLYPCLRGIVLNEKMELEVYFIVPKDWNRESFLETPVDIQITSLGDEYVLLTISDFENVVGLSEIIQSLEKLVDVNQTLIKKKRLIQAQIEALNNLTYDELSNLSNDTIGGFKTANIDEGFEYISELENFPFSITSNITTSPTIQNNVEQPTRPLEVGSVESPAFETQSIGGIDYLPMEAIQDEYDVFDQLTEEDKIMIAKEEAAIKARMEAMKGQ